MNGLEAGAGDNALTYADDLSGQLQDEVTEAARKGAGTPVVAWARGLATPDEVAAKLASIQPLRLPPPPPIGEQRGTIGNPRGDRPHARRHFHAGDAGIYGPASTNRRSRFCGRTPQHNGTNTDRNHPGPRPLLFRNP